MREECVHFWRFLLADCSFMAMIGAGTFRDMVPAMVRRVRRIAHRDRVALEFVVEKHQWCCKPGWEKCSMLFEVVLGHWNAVYIQNIKPLWIQPELRWLLLSSCCLSEPAICHTEEVKDDRRRRLLGDPKSLS